jgi:hypothetical protein
MLDLKQEVDLPGKRVPSCVNTGGFQTEQIREHHDRRSGQRAKAAVSVDSSEAELSLPHELVHGHPAHGPDIVSREADVRQLLVRAFDFERREVNRNFARRDVGFENATRVPPTSPGGTQFINSTVIGVARPYSCTVIRESSNRAGPCNCKLPRKYGPSRSDTSSATSPRSSTRKSRRAGEQGFMAGALPKSGGK